MQDLKAKIEECVKGICSNYNILEINCASIRDVGAGVYVITDGKTALTGYSSSVKNRLLVICRGDLRISQVTKLLMANLEYVLPNLKEVNSVTGRMAKLKEEIKKLTSKLTIITVTCPTANTRELHTRVKKCIST